MDSLWELLGTCPAPQYLSPFAQLIYDVATQTSPLPPADPPCRLDPLPPAITPLHTPAIPPAPTPHQRDSSILPHSPHSFPRRLSPYIPNHPPPPLAQHPLPRRPRHSSILHSALFPNDHIPESLGDDDGSVSDVFWYRGRMTFGTRILGKSFSTLRKRRVGTRDGGGGLLCGRSSNVQVGRRGISCGECSASGVRGGRAILRPTFRVSPPCHWLYAH